jgi:hypothetical protein
LGGQGPAELRQQRGLSGLRLGDSRQADGAAVAQFEPDFHQHDAAELIEQRPGRETGRRALAAFFQIDPETIAEERHHQVRLHARLGPVPDRAYLDLAFERAKRRLRFRQLDIGRPQLRRIPLRPVRPEQIRSFGAHHASKGFAIPGPAHRTDTLAFAGRDIVHGDPSPPLRMAFAQPADLLLDQIRILQLAISHAATQRAQIAPGRVLQIKTSLIFDLFIVGSPG